MSFDTQPAFVHVGSWDETTRKHPAMKWMEYYTTEWIDTRAFTDKTKDPSEVHVKEFTLHKSDNVTVKGLDSAWGALNEIYGPFAAHQHDPKFLIAIETADGWEMIGVADVNFKLQGSSSGGEWDGTNAGAFRFRYVKDGQGIKLKETWIFGDPSPTLKLMLKNKMINGEQLGAMLSQ